jgi:polar amino acid transport system substrate-binding protein
VRRVALTCLLAAAVGPASLAAGCQYPRDPNGTLDRVEGGVLRVGVAESDPWVVMDGDQPSGGAEVEMIRRFARRLRARIEWVHGSEEELVAASKEGAIDVLIGGLTSKSRWKKDVAFTRPYVETRVVVGAPSGRSYPDDFADVSVVVERGTEEQGLLERRTEAQVVPVSSLASGRGEPAAVHDYLLDDLGLIATGTELASERHVMAVPLGENAFMVRLERFLLEREGEIRELLVREGKP